MGGETVRMRVLEDAQPQRCCPDAEEVRSTLRTRTDRAPTQALHERQSRLHCEPNDAQVSVAQLAAAHVCAPGPRAPPHIRHVCLSDVNIRGNSVSSIPSWGNSFCVGAARQGIGSSGLIFNPYVVDVASPSEQRIADAMTEPRRRNGTNVYHTPVRGRPHCPVI